MGGEVSKLCTFCFCCVSERPEESNRGVTSLGKTYSFDQRVSDVAKSVDLVFCQVTRMMCLSFVNSPSRH